jgi:2,3,4,5-tetrahydropyridine-2-carboxylate N-succinyltransferase
VSVLDALEERIDRSWKTAGSDPSVPIDTEAVEEAIDLLDRGLVRIAEPVAPGEPWRVNMWAKQAVLLYFRIRGLETIESGPFEYHDKLPLKHGFGATGVRVVPPATVRYGAHIEPGAVLMPSYVNIGAYVGAGTMVDTWATVGSCAQIGADVHLAGGVGIGGVLEPVQASPVVIEDGAFVGSRCIIVEGVHVGAGAVLGAGVVLTGNTPVIDPRGDEPVEYRGRVPAGAIVVPGSRSRDFPAGSYGMPCGLVIGERTGATDDKVALNELLRDHGSSTG